MADIPIPPKFRMEAPFPDMSGKKIRVVQGELQSVGKLMPHVRPKEKLFGLRIDILGPLVRSRSIVTYLTLSQGLIRKIEKTGDPEVPYQLRLD
jgi:hypothetical protein